MNVNDQHKKLARRMTIIYLLVFLIGGMAILFCTLRTQLIQGEMWVEKIEATQLSERSDPARRGNIYSSDGKILATTVPECDLYLDLGRWPKRNAKGNVVIHNGDTVMESLITNDSAFKANLPKVCRILHDCNPTKSAQEFKDVIEQHLAKRRPGRCIRIARFVPYSDWSEIRNMKGWEKVVITKVTGVEVMHQKRAHVYGNLGECTLGYEYFDPKRGHRYTGLEGYYDSVLRGQDGRYLCRRLTRGIWLPIEDGFDASYRLQDSMTVDSTSLKPRIDGSSIVATIDTRYQDIADNSLRQSMSHFGAEAGCAILMERNTGYVLACVNLVLDTSTHTYREGWRNVSVSDSYEPGSTFKSVVLTAMMNDRKCHFDTAMRVRVGGDKYFKGDRIAVRDVGHRPDTMNVAGVLAISSNVGMCELGYHYFGNRREDLRKGMLNIFPFDPMILDVAARENKNYINPLRSGTDFSHLCYGYSCQVSPMQLVAFYNALANNGVMLKPLFCREIFDGTHRTAIQPVVLNDRVCSPEVARTITSMMVGVVEHGTGNNIVNSVYGIAGKTGTAVIAQSYQTGHPDVYNASFAGYFPADNPRYTCLVLVERVNAAGRGAAAPVFRKIADCVVALDKELGSIKMQEQERTENPVMVKGNWNQLNHIHQVLNIPMCVNDSTLPQHWSVYNNDSSRYVSYQLPQGLIPDCSGMTIRDALKMLRSMGMQVRFSGKGKVVSQSPKARTSFVKGTTVYLELK